ncbi:MAG: bifunctional phosphoribosyl-AMP cyclohydrolase/phosphoribosyl-ATP diphosphatase HisIE [Flavobacteriales bacterium]
MTLDFKKGNGLIPVVVQDANTHNVLMVGYMNEEAYALTLRDKKVTFYSRTRKKLWTKGETSGNFMFVKEITEDCDHDAILIMANPVGPVCHKGTDTCFNQKNLPQDFLYQLEAIVKSRKATPVQNSYTSSLFGKGVNKIAQKVGEEAVELVIEAKDDNKEKFLGEAADLMFHFLILLTEKGYSLEEVMNVLRSRHEKN